METATRASQADCSCFVALSPKENVVDSSSKEKKIIPGRRQQRHSTEIGSEYHRWWVVRNALGFETNEHIAGLLLDGFHGLLQQLVVMCGGEMYQPCSYGVEGRSPSDAGDGGDDLAPAPSPSSSSSTISPPGGIEDMEEFMEYKNAISHYCDSLWRLCGQQGRRLHELDNASQPVQEFLMKLMGYLRAAKGKSYNLNHKKKRFKPSSAPVRKFGDKNISESSPSAFGLSAANSVSDSLQAGASLMSPSTLTLQSSQEPIHTHSVPDQVHTDVRSNQGGQDRGTSSELATEVGANDTGHGDDSEICAKTSGRSTGRTPDVKTSGRDQQPRVGLSYPQTRGLSLVSSPGQLQSKGSKPTICREFISSDTSAVDQITEVEQYSGSALEQLSPVQQLLTDQPVTPQSQQDVSALAGVTLQGQPISTLAMACRQSVSPAYAVPRETKDQRRQQTLSLNDDPRQIPSDQYAHKINHEAQHNTKLHLQNSLSGPHSQTDINLLSYSSDKDGDRQLGGFERNVDRKEDISIMSQANCFSKDMSGHSSAGDTETDNVSEDKLRTLLNLKPPPLSPDVEGSTRNIPDLRSAFTPLKGLKKTKGDFTKGSCRRHASEASVRGMKSLGRKWDNPESMTCSVNSDTLMDKSQHRREISNVGQGRSNVTSVGANTRVGNDLKQSVSSVRHGQSGVELRCQRTVNRDSLQPIQPAPCPSAGQPLPPPALSAPLGTPVILYPANSFPASDNSLASLSSLVHNVVYNSHGSILKPLSVTPVTSVSPVCSGYTIPQQLTTISQQLMVPTPVLASDGISQRRPLAAALPVLSDQLSRTKATLLPFYISHTAMNTLSNLSKCATSLGATNINLAQLPLTPSTLQSNPIYRPPPPVPPVLQPALALANPAFSSTRLYQEWTSGASKQSHSADVTSGLNQLKITDVRSCAETEFSEFGKTTMEERIPNVRNVPRSQTDQVMTSDRQSYQTTHQSSPALVRSAAGNHFGCGSQRDLFPGHEASLEPAMSVSPHFSNQNALSNLPTPVHSSGSQAHISSQYVLGETFSCPDSGQSSAYPRPSKKLLTSLLASKPMATWDCEIHQQSQTSAQPSTTELSMKPSSHTHLLGKAVSSTRDSHSKPTANKAEKDGPAEAESKETSYVTCETSSQKQPSVSTSSQKQPSVSTSQKQSSVSTSSQKQPSVSTSSQKQSSVSTSQKQSSVSTSSSSSLSQRSRSRRLLCSVCDLLFFSGTDLLVHRYEQHSYVCGECDGRFLSLTALSQHKEVDHPAMLLCSECRFHTYSRQALSQHAWSEHRIDLSGKNNTSACRPSETVYPAQEQTELTSHRPNHTVEDTSANTAVCADSSLDEANSNCGTGRQKPDSGKKEISGSVSASSHQGLENGQCDTLAQSDSHSQRPASKPTHELFGMKAGVSVSGQFDVGSANIQPACSGPVFPSMIRQAVGKSPSAVDSVSAMYAQVSQHCHLESTEFLSLETEEPRLVIDTDLAAADTCRERLEGEGRAEQGQPLCLVTHNRFNQDTDSHGMANLSECWPQSNSSLPPHNGDDEEDAIGQKRRRLEVVRDFDQTDDDPGPGAVMSDLQSPIDLTVDQAGDREKLVMKISLKPSKSKQCPGTAHSHRRKRRRKRKRCVSAGCPIVEIDNPEDGSNETGCYMSSSYNISCGTGHHFGSADSAQTEADIERGKTTTSSAKVNVPEPEEETAENMPTSCSSYTVDKGHGQGQVKQKNNQCSLNRQTDSDGTVREHTCSGDVLSQCGEAASTTAVQARSLALRDRHVMSSLPPKKRTFRRSPRCVREDKRQGDSDLSAPPPPDKTLAGTQENLPAKCKRGQRSCVTSIETRNKTKLVTKAVTMTESQRLRQTRSRSMEGQDLRKSNRRDSSALAGHDSRCSLSNPCRPVTCQVPSQLVLQGPACMPGCANNRLVCPVASCGTTFSRKWNLDTHISKVHAKRSFIPCTVSGCNQQFPSKKELRQHITMDHNGKVRKYKCNWPECNKGFFARTHLRIHVLTHTGEKPVACQECEYRCRQRTALVWHMRKHGVFHKAGRGEGGGDV